MCSKEEFQKMGKPRESNGVVNRREFLAATTGLASATLLAKNVEGVAARMPVSSSGMGGRLAIEGGSPVRTTRLAANFPGPLYYDDAERRELLEVLDGRSPFRWYGIGPKGKTPNKCNLLEKEFAAHQGTR